MAPRELVFALRARLNAGKPVGDGEIHGAIIAQFEMQERVVFGAAPVAAKERLAPDEVERPGHPTPVALGQHQSDIAAQAFLRMVKEVPREIG